MRKMVERDGRTYQVEEEHIGGTTNSKHLLVGEGLTNIGRVAVARVMDDDGEDTFEYAAISVHDSEDECASTFERIDDAVAEVIDTDRWYEDAYRALGRYVAGDEDPEHSPDQYVK